MARQPDALPTNKLIAFSTVTLLVHHTQDAVVPPAIVEAYGVMIEIVIAGIIAYFVPDRPNQPK
jgi:hypothetical protein